MRKYIGKFIQGTEVPVEAVLGVPARDLSEEEWAQFTSPAHAKDETTGEVIQQRPALIDPDGPTGALWEQIDGQPAAATAPKPATTSARARGGDDAGGGAAGEGS